MTKQLVRISPFQTAKVLAVLYFVVSLPIVLIGLVALMFGSKSDMGAGFLLLLPFIYAVMGFVFTVIGSWIYNSVARFVGGIEVTTSEA